jgi:hypothetical protein
MTHPVALQGSRKACAGETSIFRAARTGAFAKAAIAPRLACPLLIRHPPCPAGARDAL